MRSSTDVIAEIRKCAAERAQATYDAFFGATELDRDNACANQMWIDRALVHLALELAALEG